MQAATEGGGIAMLPDFMVQDNCLTLAYPNFHFIERQVWLVIPFAIRHPPAIDVVIRTIKAQSFDAYFITFLTVPPLFLQLAPVRLFS